MPVHRGRVDLLSGFGLGVLTGGGVPLMVESADAGFRWCMLGGRGDRLVDHLLESCGVVELAAQLLQ